MSLIRNQSASEQLNEKWAASPVKSRNVWYSAVIVLTGNRPVSDKQTSSVLGFI